MKTLIALTTLMVLGLAPLTAETGPDRPAGRTVVVKMLDAGGKMRFEPANVTVRKGDVVRFVQEGAMPHNVEFKDRSLGIPAGPYIVEKGKSYDVRIDDRFKKGAFEYICTPHAAMGMKGTLNVAG